MALFIEVVRVRDWRRLWQGGAPVTAETTGAAAETLERLIAEGEACARAMSDQNVALIACKNPDGTCTVAGRLGLAVGRDA